MAFIQMILAIVILGFLYTRMLKRETPEPVGKLQAIVPVPLGILSLLLSLIFTLAFGALFASMGFSSGNIEILPLRALFSAFFVAGLTEELAKILMMLLSIKLFRPKNVYEYILIGAGVGVGFTVFEEFIYGSGAAALTRIITIALHVAFGVIMAKHIGTAAFRKIHYGGSAAAEYVQAFVIPVLLHTCYDAATANNPVIKAADDFSDLSLGAGIVIGAAAVIVGAIGQVVVLVRVSKNTEKYCGMATR